MLTTPWTPSEIAVKHDDTGFWNAVLSYSDQPVQLPGKTSSISFRQADRPDGGLPAHRIKVRESDDLIVVCESFPFNALFNLELNYADIAVVAEPLRGALYEGVVSTLLGAMPDDVSSDLKLEATGALAEICDPGTARKLTWLAVTVSGIAAENVEMTVGLTPRLVAETLSTDRISGQAVWKELGNHIGVAARPVAGYGHLSLGDFENLAVGDAVLLTVSDSVRHVRVADLTFEFARGEEGWACSGSFRTGTRFLNGLSGDNRGGTVQTEQDETTQESDGAAEAGADAQREEGQAEPVVQQTEASADTAQVDPAPAADAPLDQVLPVTLEFGFAERQVPLAEIEAWQPGSIVELDMPEIADGISVAMRVNGQIVGHGDLVKIDDRVAVRISQLHFSRT